MGFDQQTPRSVKITADGYQAWVELDGVSISPFLAGYRIEHEAGEHPEVIFRLAGNTAGQTVFEGMARVAVEETVDIARFLGSIDPAELEKAALNRDDLSPEPSGLVKAMLTQLAEWAAGR